MKTIIIIVLGVFLFNVCHAQKIEFDNITTVDMEKAVIKSGMYAGTYFDSEKVNVLYYMSSEKAGVNLFNYSFDSQMKPKDFNDLFISKEDAEKEFGWYLPQEEVEKVASGKEKFLLAGSTFGSGMKVEFGRIKKHYQQGIFTSWTFEQEGKIKPKTGDIWRIQPSAYKTTSDYTKLATAYGFSEDLQKIGFPLLAPESATLLAVGVITEKIKIKNPPPTLGNRVAVLAINGENFDDTKSNIYLLPFSALGMGTGLGQDDNLCALYAPHNAPSTLRQYDHLRWKDRQNHYTMMRFSDQYTLVDSVSFQSELVWGKFRIYNDKESSFIVGMGNTDFNGWSRNADMIGLKKINAIQVTKIKDGVVAYNSEFSDDLLEERLVVPEGVKSKYNFHIHNNYIREIIALPNGDSFVLGRSPLETYALQISSEGELKAFYKINSLDEKDSRLYNYQLLLKGDNIYLVLNEQPYKLSNDTKVSTSSSTISGGGMSTTHTTTTVKRLNEVFVQSKIVEINTSELKISNELIIDGKDYYSLGSYPALFTKDAIYFTARKGIKGKTLNLLRIGI